MNDGMIVFKNGHELKITNGAASTIATALNRYWENPKGLDRVVSSLFSSDGGTNNNTLTVDLESVMFVISK